MTPSVRDLPIVDAVYHELAHAWLVTLPGNLKVPARDEAEVEALVKRLAPFSAIRYRRVTAGPETAADAGRA